MGQVADGGMLGICASVNWGAAAGVKAVALLIAIELAKAKWPFVIFLFLGQEYDWRNYQPSQMSESELQMLASLRRQQNEELEDAGTSHGLSASQVDNCNVSISTSSDDTTTWNSCLPPVSPWLCSFLSLVNKEQVSLLNKEQAFF